jgi:anti-anti-sigma regulatory factor
MMWRLRKIVEGDLIILRLSGRIEGEQLNEIKELFASADDATNVVFDLEETKLVDREAIAFLSRCQEQGTKLRSCPAYIEEWIAREKDGVGNGRKH